ncbi:hypothetical protein P7K49_003647 [Saguinus oedipus]|uniref:Uncharacterized protein n=1 Tax=Saguinus oedipus TaxID=9490 RepID=A0ABQ9W539_SAGOE|nr:hypothetical protein P7K49_003647 [Saguinus oedipus]
MVPSGSHTLPAISSSLFVPLSSCQCTSWILVACTMVSSLWGLQAPPTEERADEFVRTALNTAAKNFLEKELRHIDEPWATMTGSDLHSPSQTFPSKLSRQDLEAREDAGYASLELPGDSTLSPPTLDTEETSDDLISPYASFSFTADRPMPLLSGWLDKLSPQGWVLGGEGREK